MDTIFHVPYKPFYWTFWLRTTVYLSSHWVKRMQISNGMFPLVASLNYIKQNRLISSESSP